MSETIEAVRCDNCDDLHEVGDESYVRYIEGSMAVGDEEFGEGRTVFIYCREEKCLSKMIKKATGCSFSFDISEADLPFDLPEPGSVPDRRYGPDFTCSGNYE